MGEGFLSSVDRRPSLPGRRVACPVDACPVDADDDHDTENDDDPATFFDATAVASCSIIDAGG